MEKKFKESEDMKWAPLVFPWLSPQSIASLALTCGFFRPLSKKINTLRIADAARGLENYPVPVSNTVDDILYPYFLYTSTSILSISSPKQQWGHETLADHLTSKPLISDSEILEGAGCNCIDCSKEEQECSCNELSVYTDDGRILFSGGCSNPNFEGSEDNTEIGDLNPNFEGFEDNVEIEGLDGGPLVVMECGPACRCGEGCRNRVSQRSLSARVEIVRHFKKGWGLHVAEPVKRGAFVCEYAGEFLTTAEARERQRHYDEVNLNKCNFGSALLVIREHLPSGQACLRLNIDATIIGNVARFINHSCDGGNLFPTLVRSSGSILPRLCFFASRDISPGEELTFSYGVVGKNSKTLSCFCNSPACCGMLPSEQT